MIKIHKADSFEYIREMPDNSCELILTDPPFDFCDGEKMFLQYHFERISTGAVIVFAPPENPWIFPADEYLFWEKPISTKNTIKSYSRFVEEIFLYGTGTLKAGRHWSNYVNIFTDRVDSTKTHPFRKPPSLMERLVLNHTNPGDLVCDPFAGSGVVGEVCERNNRRYFLVDKETGTITL